MALLTNLLRLLVLLLLPLGLSWGMEALGIRLSLSGALSGWIQAGREVDPGLGPSSLPPAGWREAAYLAANPDVAAAVRTGTVASGYAHYRDHGQAEGRSGGFAPAPVPSAPMVAPIVERVAGLPAASAPDLPAVRPPSQPAPGPAPDPGPIPSAPPPAAPLPAVKPAPPQPAPPDPPRTEARVEARDTVPDRPAPVLVSRIRTGTSEGTLRIVLDLDRAPRFEPPARRADGTLVVTLPDTRWQTAATGRLASSPLSYRTETADGLSRLVIVGGAGQGRPLPKAVFAMVPEGDRGHRLVIDLAAPAGKPAGKAAGKTAAARL